MRYRDRCPDKLSVVPDGPHLNASEGVVSNFECPLCGATCLDSENGYVTGCEHYPVESEIEPYWDLFELDDDEKD